MKKHLLVVATALTLSGTALGLGSEAIANAQTTTSTNQTAKTGKAKHSGHHVRLEARLNQAVRDGTITQAQKSALTAELKQLQQERRSALSKSSTKAERQTERTKLKTELQSWARSNNFPLSKILPKLAS